MRTRQQGFTLVEVVVVIVILGILAAVAIPRYISVTGDARKAAINGMAGAVRSAVAVVQARYVASGSLTSELVTMADGTTVIVNAGAGGGIPTGVLAGIGNAVKIDGFAFALVTGNATAEFTFASAITDCKVIYTVAGGTAAVVSTGC